MNDNENDILAKATKLIKGYKKQEGFCPCPLILGQRCPLLESIGSSVIEIVTREEA